MTYIIVFYDVSDDRRRLMLAEFLKSMGLTRIQRSVFMGKGGYSKAKDIARKGSRLIDRATDSLVVLVAPEDYARRMIVVGTTWDEPPTRKRDERVRIL